MIRERVSTIGVCRPLEPSSELAALTMPSEEVGVIKEGQAMRYLNGQKLWDKKFHRAAHSVEKHRKKNLKMAKERDGKKLVRLWEDRLKHGHGSGSGNGSPQDSDGDNGWETDGIGQEKGLMDQSWSWEWALHGEAPPPSAIVSRRDFVSPLCLPYLLLPFLLLFLSYTYIWPPFTITRSFWLRTCHDQSQRDRTPSHIPLPFVSRPVNVPS